MCVCVRMYLNMIRIQFTDSMLMVYIQISGFDTNYLNEIEWNLMREEKPHKYRHFFISRYISMIYPFVCMWYHLRSLTYPCTVFGWFISTYIHIEIYSLHFYRFVFKLKGKSIIWLLFLLCVYNTWALYLPILEYGSFLHDSYINWKSIAIYFWYCCQSQRIFH